MELTKLREYFESPPIELNEWLEQKRGKVSASLIHKYIKGGETAKTYIKTLVGETLGVYEDDPYQSQAMINGSINELTAIQTYISLHAEGEVLYGSKIFIPFGENAGISPDAIELLNTERVYLEVKCPSAGNKFVEFFVGDLKTNKPDAFWQCVMNCRILECKKAKLLIFHPNLGLHIIEIMPTQVEFDTIDKAIENAVSDKLKLTEQLILKLNS